MGLNPLDLHVLGTPPAFILSQDQTLIATKLQPSEALREGWVTNIVLVRQFYLLKANCELACPVTNREAIMVLGR